MTAKSAIGPKGLSDLFLLNAHCIQRTCSQSFDQLSKNTFRKVMPSWYPMLIC